MRGRTRGMRSPCVRGLRGPRAVFLFTGLAALTSVGAACSAAPVDGPDDGTEESGLRTLSDLEKVGTLTFGETRDVDYSETPLYRAFRVEATPGDKLDAWVRSDDADAKAWILGSDYRTLASNDDADATTLDAHVVYTAREAASYYLVLREKNRESATFTVSLAPRSGSSGDAGADAAADAASEAGAANLYGFTDGQRVAARAGGTLTQNIGPSYQCHRKTNTGVPCGGWVALSSGENGKTKVTLGVMGHYAFYGNVSSHPEIGFPPPASNRFWNESAVVEFDATGHGHYDYVRKSSTAGFIESTASYDVQAIDGVISVEFSSVGRVQSCTSYDETCSIRVLAP